MNTVRLLPLVAIVMLACPKRSAAEGEAVEPLLAQCELLLRAGEAGQASALLAAAAEPGHDATIPAEVLWKLAQQNLLVDELADAAAALLDDDDPFARALAEWAIATRVGCDNNGQQVVWPKAHAPTWFAKWLRLAPQSYTDCDYARLAVAWNIHRDGPAMLASVVAIIKRARGAAAEALDEADSETRRTVAQQMAELESIRAQLADRVRQSPGDLVAQRELWLAARRAARPIVLANPAVDFDRLLFVKGHSPHSHRNITGSQYPWIQKPGGGIVVQEGLQPGDAVRDVLAGQLGPGHVHGMDLWWDADRLVFGFARQADWPPPHDTARGDWSFELRLCQEPTHLYEIDLDGSGLRQLTDDRRWNDFEPTYCADGQIAFASDRSGRSSECGKFSADHTVVNLYRLLPTTGRVERLSDNKDIDRYPHSLDDGTIGYTRWEYQERHFFEVHAVWRVRPDGTMSDALFDQHLAAPFGLRDTRSIPGSSKLVSILTGHHTFAYGPVVTLDPTQGINVAEAIRLVTPHIKPEEGPLAGLAVDQGGVPDRLGLFQTPWALSETCFLASYSPALPPSGTQGDNNATGFAIYLIDIYGNKELLHRDPVYSCSIPIPLRKRPRPPQLPDARQPAQSFATCYVSDVYRGLEATARGGAKYLRVAQRVGWPLDDRVGAMRYIPGNAYEKQFGYWEWAPVRVIGTVPIEADGSACFEVPVDTAVYFQLLDENFMELRRMRSHVTLQAGEVRGCIGCHESRPTTPPHDEVPSMAMRQPPHRPDPPAWGSERLLGYEWLIQPILDRRCVSCHDGTPGRGDVDLTGVRADDGFFQSFRTLFGVSASSSARRPALVSVSDRFDGAAVTKPKQFGSHQSELVRLLREDELHRREAALDTAEWVALVTWIDANAPYHDTFFNRRPDDGGAPRREIRLDLPPPFAARENPWPVTMLEPAAGDD